MAEKGMLVKLHSTDQEDQAKREAETPQDSVKFKQNFAQLNQRLKKTALTKKQTFVR